jgi:putative ABC transport system permease protein
MFALGMGIAAAVFRITSAALLEGFPLVERSDRIVYITTTKGAVFYPDYTEWRSAKSFEDVALARNVYVTLGTSDGDLGSYFTTEVTANAFGLLRVQPFIGRDFAGEDERAGAEPVAILRYDFWQSHFGSERGIVGRSVRVNGVPTAVIGVMPRGFSFPTDQDLWTPLIPTPAALRRESPYARYAVARLADDATIDTARAEMTVIADRLASEYPATNRGMGPVVQTFAEWSAGPKGSLLYKVALGAVVFVLLIVCANAAIMLLERTLSRSRDMAIRAAIGAGRARIVRALFLESLLLSWLGGGVGVWVATIGLRAYARMLPSGDYTRALAYTMGRKEIAFIAAVATVAGLVVGAIASTGLARVDIGATLRNGTATVSRNEGRQTGLLVALQVSLAVVLLAGAGLLVRSYVNLATADVGVRGDHVLSMSMYVPPERYVDDAARTAFYASLRERIAAIPEVESVGFGTAAPAEFVPSAPYEIEGAPAAEAVSRPEVARFVADVSYFRTLGVQLVAGRDFADTDRASTLPVVIVNKQFASAHWPAENPIGKRLRLFAVGEPTPWLTVVGVVANVVQNDWRRRTFEPLVYVPYEQKSQPNMFAFARTRVAPEALAAAFRREVYALDPALPVPALWPLGERFDRLYAFERLTTRALIAFAGTAVLLASIGLYAALSRAMSGRTHEVGVRAALGATARDIARLVIRAAALPVGLGLVVGTASSLVIGRVLEPELVGVSPTDPVTLAVVLAVIVGATALGCVMPLRRALLVDPVVALRHD